MTIQPVEVVLIECGNERREWGHRGETLKDFFARVRKTPALPFEHIYVRDPQGVLLEAYRTLDFFISNWQCGNCEACKGRPRKPCTQSPIRLFAEQWIDWPKRCAALEAELSALRAAEALAGQEEAPQPRIAALVDRLVNDAMYECNDSPVEDEIRDWCARQRSYDDFCSGCRTNALLTEAASTITTLAAKAEEHAPAPPRYPEESLATRILFEQKDLEAHTRAVTDVDRLTQIRDTLLKEPQP
jgi:hypothetical protein